MMQAVNSAVSAYGEDAADLGSGHAHGHGNFVVTGPQPVLAPKGLVGILEGRSLGATELLDTSQLTANSVLLNVYDVGGNELLHKINRATTGNNSVLIGGVFHAGVEVYGTEWGYGSTEEDRTGIGAHHPRMNQQHTYRATVPMGNTKLKPKEVNALLTRMTREWRGNEYDLIHNNCLSFCNALMKELGLGRIPGWIDRASRTASKLDKAVKLVRTISADDVIEKIKRDSAEVLEVETVQAKAMEIGEKAQETVQAFGAGLWQWGQELTRKGVGDDGGGLGEKVLDFREKAQEQAQAIQANLFQWGQELQQTNLLQPWGNAASQPQAARRSQRRQVGVGQGSGIKEWQREDTAVEADPLPSLSESMGGDERGTKGFIQAREEQFLKVGLLAEDDEDEDFGLFSADNSSQVPAAPRVPPQRRARPPARPIVEAPADWLSGDTAGPMAAPAVDLLSGQVSDEVPDPLDLLG
mmetsp:Transcript_20738/g.44239  ORF Transcript_20738/g.44239 Transcript_20738/m.44239 type:complete len:469 (-) Transcript_20738:264-1670(-)